MDVPGMKPRWMKEVEEGHTPSVSKIDVSTMGMPDAEFRLSVLPGYDALAAVLQRALDQAQLGKGAERHATGLPFEQQPMQSISQLVGSADGLIYQAIKKAQESQRLPEGRDIDELLGAINYLAGAVIFKGKQRAKTR